MHNPLDDEAALEAVLAFLDAPPLEGSEEDRLFGRLLRQVNEAAAAPMAEPDEASLFISGDLHRRLVDLERQRGVLERRSAPFLPFGEHPDGIGPTVGIQTPHL